MSGHHSCFLLIALGPSFQVKGGDAGSGVCGRPRGYPRGSTSARKVRTCDSCTPRGSTCIIAQTNRVSSSRYIGQQVHCATNLPRCQNTTTRQTWESFAAFQSLGRIWLHHNMYRALGAQLKTAAQRPPAQADQQIPNQTTAGCISLKERCPEGLLSTSGKAMACERVHVYLECTSSIASVMHTGKKRIHQEC